LADGIVNYTRLANSAYTYSFPI